MNTRRGLRSAGIVALAATLTATAAQAGPTVTAQVESVQGHTTRSIKTPAGAPAPVATRVSAGDALPEGTRLKVPDDGYLRLRLADGSVVEVLAGSDVELRRLRGKRPGSASRSVIQVHRGKVESDVAPQPEGRMFEIAAPGAVASVRGTRFAVAIDANGQVAATVTEGVVELRQTTARGATARLTAGQSAVIDRDGRMQVQRVPSTIRGSSPVTCL